MIHPLRVVSITVPVFLVGKLRWSISLHSSSFFPTTCSTNFPALHFPFILFSKYHE